MPAYDIINETLIDANPEQVWAALLAEFAGAAAWWVPHNTFEPGPEHPGRVGGETRVTVHTKGVDNKGPRLRFTARTTAVEPNRSMTTTYVEGAFRGAATYSLIPVDGGSRTKLWMRFQARPSGIVKVLGKVVDMGAKHKAATDDAFRNLDALLTGTASTPTSQGSRARREVTVRTDDGAALAVTQIAGTSSDEPTVLLVHGWGAGRAIWDDVVDRLTERGRPVVLYDQRGHGASTLGSERFGGIGRLGRDLSCVVQELELGDVVIVGHSGGGYAALSHVIDHPPLGSTRIRGLALVATAAHGQKAPAPERVLMGSRPMQFALSRRRLGARLLSHTMGPDRSAAALEKVRAMFAATPRKVRRAAFSSTTTMDFRPDLSTVRVPTVVLAGALDEVVKPEFGRQLADALPQASYEEVGAAGHMLPLEAPDVVAARVDGLCRRHN